jgi:hypothetical protein
MTNIDTFVADLVSVAPVLRGVLDEHLADQGGELLPHLFAADVTRWLSARGPEPTVLAVLEHHLADGDDEVRNVVALGVLENLEPGNVLRAALGPGLRAELAALERWPPGPPPTT